MDQEGAVDAALAVWWPTLGVAVDAEVRGLWFAAQERHLAA